MTSKTITGIVTWLKGWFYTKDEITTKENALQTQINNKASQSDLNTLSSTVSSKLDSSAYVVDSALSSSSENPVQNKVVNTGLSNKVDKVSGKSLSTNDFTTAYKTQLDNLSTNLASKTVTVEKLATAETGFLASYVVKQNGVQVGNTINIPKDFLLKSGTIETVTVANQPVTGYVVGDKYLDLVINTKTSDGTDEHIYVLVSDLVSSSVDWSDIQNKPSTFTPSSHTHGNINNDGTIDVNSASFSTLNYPLVRDNSDGKLKTGLVPTERVRSSTAYSNIGSYANATQNTINGLIDTAIGGLWDGVEGKRNVQRAHCEVPDEAVEEGHYYKLGGIVYNAQNQGMSFLDVMVDDYDRIVQVCYEYDNGEAPDNDVHQYIRYSTNNGSTWSAWKRFVEEDEVTNKADKRSVIDWDTLTFVAKADDESGAITFDYLE